VQLNWHVLVVRSGFERQISDYLNRSGIETFCPLQEITKIRFGHIIEDYKAIFIGYLFVRWYTYNPEQWHFIKDINGVIEIIGGEIPKQIPHGIIEQWQSRLDDNNVLLDMVQTLADMKRGFKVGDEIRMNKGTYHSLTGICVWADDKNQRVGVKICLLGRDCVLVRRVRDCETVSAPVLRNRTEQARRGGRRGHRARKRAFVAYVERSLKGSPHLRG
jgi:transcription antitermination factor NusG